MKMINNLHQEARPKIVMNLRHLVKSSAEAFGDKVLYKYKVGKNYVDMTYSEFYESMNKIGAALTKVGLNDCGVAVTGTMHPYYICSYLATVNGSGYIVPIDPDISDEQTVNFLKLAEVKVLFYTVSQRDKIVRIKNDLPEIKLFIELNANGDPADGAITIQELMAVGEEEIKNGHTEYMAKPIDLEKMSALLFTSGTTGTSKGVMLSQKNLTAATNASCLTMSYDYNNTFVSCLPPHHSYEITCGNLAIMNLGATILINDSLKSVMRNFASFKPNALMLVPLFVETMHKKINDEVKKKNLTFAFNLLKILNSCLLFFRIDVRDKLFASVTGAFGGNLKSIVCGGAPVSAEIIKDFYSFGITVLEGYGITECSPLVAVNSPGKVKFRSVGTPVYGCSVKIDNPDPEDGTGEILVKGENVMMGYYRNPEATAEVFTEDGWFRTGDIGYMDEENYIFITGRKKNVIILSNGKNVFPEELEEYINAVPEILESVVLTRANETTSEQEICAVCVPNYEILGEEISDEDAYKNVKSIIDDINKKLPSHKMIRRIEIRKEPFERTTSKKIKRFTVK